MLYDLAFVTLAALIISVAMPIVMRFMMSEAKSVKSTGPLDLTDECYREYQWPLRGEIPYRINNPQKLYIGTTTHRIVDATNTVHCLPAPGYHGCVLRWVPKKGRNPVKF